MAFPSITYLSLYGLIGLKPYINAPCLATFHEGWYRKAERFSSPLPSLSEYGVYRPPSKEVDPATWHRSFPNLLRLTIRAGLRILTSFLRSLSSDPDSLPALRMMSVRYPDSFITEKEQAIMKGLAQVRREAYQMDFTLYFETERPLQIPLFFGEVSDCLSNSCGL